MPRTVDRGTSLVTAMIIVLVITLIGVGISFASREVVGSPAGARRQALVSCPESARKLLLSRFHAVGLAPKSPGCPERDARRDRQRPDRGAGWPTVDQAASIVQVARCSPCPTTLRSDHARPRTSQHHLPHRARAATRCS